MDESLWTDLGPVGDDGPMASPFDEIGPSPLARRAAEAAMVPLRAGRVAGGIASSVLEGPAGGKMFGVLVVRRGDGRTGFLRAFSGTLDGRFDVPGFVPPVFDAAARAAVEVDGEKLVKSLLAREAAFVASGAVEEARRHRDGVLRRHDEERAALRTVHAARRRERRAARLALDGSGPDDARERTLHALAQQSRGDKAERRAMDERHATGRRDVEARWTRVERRLGAHARLHAMVSRHLMRRIHDSYSLANRLGERTTLRALFAPGEPPGGAADCAAPKLVAYAVAHGLEPLAIAEFWWGAPPPSGGRVAGAFYPACRDKCGPVLPFLLRGTDVACARRFVPPDATGLDLAVVFEDDRLVVVDKPAGLLSVPSRRGAADDSVLARLDHRCRGTGPALVVHRLDLDTSGLLVFARDAAAHAALQRQFLRRTVRKRYVAILDGDVAGDEGTIELPMRVDVHDRPRQVVDPVHGRAAVTHWSVVGREAGRTRVVLVPLTGRTHQLRVHAAHPLGLGAPIAGDRLYGRGGGRLMLHAQYLAFEHPATGGTTELASPVPF